VACADISTDGPVDAPKGTASPPEACHMPRMLLFAIPLSGVLWAGIILLAVRLRIL